MTRCAWSRCSHAFARWVLALMLLAALAPALSRAMGVQTGGAPPPGQAGVDWIEICGPSGVRWIALGGAETASVADPVKSVETPSLPSAHAAVLDHCALCSLGVDRCLPVDIAPLDASARGPHAQPPTQLTPRLPDWPHARPRATGPPLLS
ncbi:MAG: hypothetical protein QUV35_02135 [Hydrogenophaga sp.]|uniref:DUF2946 family protein n=1 Tax=Hydrogenophaga sp. TaxID=1904254 RepID=UPI002616B135|nr:DUF2946 family protein [Hydrogenophaga sp.]MDM7941405.1 hypothetical protein [Hydrogenophaga sp.]